MFIHKNGKVDPDETFFQNSDLMFLFVVMLVLAIFASAFAVMTFWGVLLGVGQALLPFGLVIFAAYMTFKGAKNCYDRAHMKYEITKEGLVIQYPFEQASVLPWYMFQDVCICNAPDPPTLRAKFVSDYGGGMVVIVLARPEATKHPLYHRWNPCNVFRFRDTLAFDYSQELEDEFREKCPRSLIDRRNED